VKPKRSIAILLVLALLMSACGTSQVLSTLEAVVAAAEVALPIVGAAAGVPPPVIAAIQVYLRAVSQASAQAAVILAGPGTAAAKAAQITQAFSAIAAGCNCIPPGTPTQVVSVIDAIARAVINFLANFQPPPGSSARVAAPKAIAKVSKSDQEKLAAIRARAEIIIQKLERKTP
jgi:hypothetical protein